MAEFEAHLCVDVPAVEEATRVLVVSCGQTSAEVKEHGAAGSGDWAAWKSGGYVIGPGGTTGYPYERAVGDARAYVRQQETSRLLHQNVSALLAEEAS